MSIFVNIDSVVMDHHCTISDKCHLVWRLHSHSDMVSVRCSVQNYSIWLLMHWAYDSFVLSLGYYIKAVLWHQESFHGITDTAVCGHHGVVPGAIMVHDATWCPHEVIIHLTPTTHCVWLWKKVLQALCYMLAHCLTMVCWLLKHWAYDIPLWARGPQRLGWGAELTHTATGEW